MDGTTVESAPPAAADPTVPVPEKSDSVVVEVPAPVESALPAPAEGPVLEDPTPKKKRGRPSKGAAKENLPKKPRGRPPKPEVEEKRRRDQKEAEDYWLASVAPGLASQDTTQIGETAQRLFVTLWMRANGTVAKNALSAETCMWIQSPAAQSPRQFSAAVQLPQGGAVGQEPAPVVPSLPAAPVPVAVPVVNPGQELN